MDTRTGELRMFADGEEIPERFTQVPERLQGDAKEQLGDSLIGKYATRKQLGGRNLLAWAKNERNKRKRERKAQRKARKKNR